MRTEEGRCCEALFLDESGDHSLDRIDANDPVFVLGGIIVERAYYLEFMESEIGAFKQRHLGSSELVLHTTDIIRGRNGFDVLNDEKRRQAFYAAMNDLMRALEYQIVACAVMKSAYVKAHGADQVDPYALCLEHIARCLCDEIGDVADGGIIFAERRRGDLDEQLEFEWGRIRMKKVQTDHGLAIERSIIDLSLKSKKLNIAGLQLADLVVSPIGRHLLGKTPREDWEIVQTKLSHRNGSYEGHGLTVLE